MKKQYIKRNRNLDKWLPCSCCEIFKKVEEFPSRKHNGLVVSRCSWCYECRREADRKRTRIKTLTFAGRRIIQYKYGFKGISFNKKRNQYVVIINKKFIGRYRTLEAARLAAGALTNEQTKFRPITSFETELGNRIALA